MKLSLQEVLSFGGLLHATVLAGEDKLETTYIESVTTIEVTDNLIGDWVKKNQLCITTMYAIRDDLEQQLNLVKILHREKCAALWTIVNKKDTIFKYIFWERLDSLPIPECCFHFIWCQIA